MQEPKKKVEIEKLDKNCRRKREREGGRAQGIELGEILRMRLICTYAVIEDKSKA